MHIGQENVKFTVGFSCKNNILQFRFSFWIEYDCNTNIANNSGGIRRMKLSTQLNHFKKNFELLTLALPALVFIFIFNYIPLYGLILPFIDFKYDKGIFGSPWAGLANFKYLINSDSLISITRNTILFNAVFIFIGTVAAVAVALMLYELSRRFVKLYQTILFLPFFISWVIASYIFLALLDMNYGLLNKIVVLFGGQSVMWYNEPKYWPVIIVVCFLWKTVGYNALLFYTALMGISEDYFEAARIDGASRIQQIRYISMPSIKPLAIMLALMAVGRIFYGDFGLFYNVTLDSPLLYPVTDIIDTFVYRSLRQSGDLGMASAAGFYQSVLGFILVLTVNKIVSKTSPENSLF